MPFASLGLSPDLVRATSERRYAAPTEIQSAAIPVILRGGDVLGQAQTGSGKTAAFALPLLQLISQRGRQTPRELHTLVLVPTRELAAQIADSMAAYAKTLPEPIKIAAVFGGVSINPQMMALRGGAEVVVATPGRLLDLLRSNALRVFGVSTLVLDEADRLLDLGFAEELQRILALLPRRRQNLFFSATFPPAVQALASTLLHEPVRIEVATSVQTAPVIHQRAIEVDVGKRTQLLRHLVKEGGASRVLVFVATQYATEHVAEKLARAGINAAPFHGDLSQGARTQVLDDFKASALQVVIATDVAARGIDIVQLPMVVNYDLPRSADDYVHRIGRTGRAGRSGTAISFVSPETESHFRLIEKRQQQRVPRERIEGFEPMAQAGSAEGGEAEGAEGVEGVEAFPGAIRPDPNGGIKGRRKSKKDKLREAAALAEAAPARRGRGGKK